MTFGTLLFCTVVLYAPHCLLCAIALIWQPMLIILSLLSTFMAFIPLVLTGLCFRLLQLCRISRASTLAAWLLAAQFLFQSATRVAVLHGCLQLQRLGWGRGWLLVRSRVPLVSLSIAVGAGFAGASLFLSGGALLAEAWAARLAIPLSAAQLNATTTTLETLLGASPSCAQLSRLAQSVFQQTFFSCCQVAWTVMLGQAYAAAYPQALESTLLVAPEDGETRSANRVDPFSSGSTALEATQQPQQQQKQRQSLLTAHASERAEEREDKRHGESTQARRATSAAREEIARFAQEAETYLPLVNNLPNEVQREETTHQAPPREGIERSEVAGTAREVSDHTSRNAVGSMSERKPREEKDAASGEHHAAIAPDARQGSKAAQNLLSPGSTGGGAGAVASPSSPHSPVLSGLLAESVLSQQQPAALLTGLAALGLHLMYVMLPLSALSQASSPASSSTVSDNTGCSAYIPLQCLITIVSVVWGLWIVHCERHPFAYIRLG